MLCCGDGEHVPPQRWPRRTTPWLSGSKAYRRCAAEASIANTVAWNSRERPDAEHDKFVAVAASLSEPSRPDVICKIGKASDDQAPISRSWCCGCGMAAPHGPSRWPVTRFTARRHRAAFSAFE